MIKGKVSLTNPAVNGLTPSAFTFLRDMVVEDHADAPSYLREAEPAGIGLREINSENWLEVACSPAVRFVTEVQVRGFFIDFLLREIADLGTPIYEECRCIKAGKSTGIADYMVKVGGKWIPVEAKLALSAERDLPGQVAQYLDVETFRPAKRKTGIPVEGAKAALAIDQEGVSILSGSGFIKGGPGVSWLE